MKTLQVRGHVGSPIEFRPFVESADLVTHANSQEGNLGKSATTYSLKETLSVTRISIVADSHALHTLSSSPFRPEMESLFRDAFSVS
jgi:hypothetical protein